jgi:glycosyl-4,4'-diaponeurosporenoate acyltransferase
VSVVSTPLGELPAWAVLVANIAGWVVWLSLIGWCAHRLPTNWLDHDTWLTRPRSLERRGHWYESVWRVRVWKDWLPEGGAFYRGGFAKRSVAGGAVDVMTRFVAETRRAEYAHWAMMAGAPLFFAWNSWRGDVVNVAFALAVNMPCLVVQRYNRLRLTRVLSRRAAAE